MKHIFASGIEISAVTLGTGGAIDSDALIRLLDRYYELGGRTIDTAAMYDQLGEPSESVIGRWMKSRGVKSEMTVITKGGFPRERMRPECIEQDIERSLDLLGFVPDVYLLHRDAPDRHVGEFAELCSGFVSRGLTRAWGVSNWDNSRIKSAELYCTEHRLTPACLSQIQWSLASTTGALAGDDTLVCMTDGRRADYAASQMPLMAFASQAKGFFSKYASGAPFSPKIEQRFLNPVNLARAERVKRLSNGLGVSAAAVALSYIVDSGLNAAAVVGCLTVGQLEDSMTACSLTLTKEQCDYLYGG